MEKTLNIQELEKEISDHFYRVVWLYVREQSKKTGISPRDTFKQLASKGKITVRYLDELINGKKPLTLKNTVHIQMMCGGYRGTPIRTTTSEENSAIDEAFNKSLISEPTRPNRL